MLRTALSTLGGGGRATDAATDASPSTSTVGKAERMVSVATTMARMLRDRPLGSTRVTCSVRGLEGIRRAHEGVIAECDVVARDLPRIARCVDADADEEGSAADATDADVVVLKENRRTKPQTNDDDVRRRRTVETTASLFIQSSSSQISSDVGEDEVPLYARRKWKAPLRLDVRAGASLGNIETVVE